MAVISFRGSIPPLTNATRVTMAMPDLLPADGGLWKVIWILGDEGKQSDWIARKTDMEALSRRTGCMTVMTEGLHSDYENMVRGLRWYDYVTDGLPRYIRSIFPVSDKSEDNFVFGYGMGGLGAFRIAMRDPDFAAAYGCCSADFDIFAEDSVHSGPEYEHRMKTIYGDDLRSAEVLERCDPFTMAEKAVTVPKMLICGDASAQRIAGTLSEKNSELSFMPLTGENALEESLRAFESFIR